MEREILFRGKRVPDGKWIYGDLIQYGNRKAAIFEYRITAFGCECTEMSKRSEVLPDTIGQYTGLTDKNGNKIFEGDIVHLKGDGYDGAKVGKDYYRVVTFHEGSFCLSIEDGVHYPVRTPIYEHCDGHSIVNWVVIGNIHDNLEMMKGGSNEA